MECALFWESIYLAPRGHVRKREKALGQKEAALSTVKHAGPRGGQSWFKSWALAFLAL